MLRFRRIVVHAVRSSSSSLAMAQSQITGSEFKFESRHSNRRFATALPVVESPRRLDASGWSRLGAVALAAAATWWCTNRPQPTSVVSIAGAAGDSDPACLRTLAEPLAEKRLVLSPGPWQLLFGEAGAHLGVAARIGAAAWWFVARSLRCAELAILFAPAAFCAPLLLTPFGMLHSIAYAQLLRSMEWAGATLCKLGQWASHREDMLPHELCSLLARLRMSAPAHSAAETRRIIEQDLCSQVGCFRDFSISS